MRDPLLWLVLALAVSSCGAADGPLNAPAELARGEPRDGLLYARADCSPGYTLLAPLQSTSTYLVDIEGRPVHEWTSDYKPGQGARLLDSGHLLRACRLPDTAFERGGQGGRIEERDWDGNLLWEFDFANAEHLHHHDFDVLPNGNVLLIAWERKTRAEALARGRDPALVGTQGMWPDFVVEIEPVLPRGGRIVWEWHVWDHLVQDRNAQLAGFGRVDEHPGRVDVNGDRPAGRRDSAESERARERQLRALGYLGGDGEEDGESARADPGLAGDWLHTNSIDYHPELDQILLSVRSFNEIWIIDHSTTTEQAAGSSGGRAGRGGEILYRWGNPRAYGAGRAIDRQLFLQHDAHWIAPDHPGAGHILVFNNGRDRPKELFSSVVEIELPLAANGGYERRAGEPFGPPRPLWTHTASERTRFYSGHVSGAQRLPNGNTLVCSGEQGWVFEVEPAGAIVWDFLNPFGRAPALPERDGADADATSLSSNSGPFAGRARAELRYGGLFRALRFPPEHPAVARISGAGAR